MDLPTAVGCHLPDTSGFSKLDIRGNSLKKSPEKSEIGKTSDAVFV
jgi:hypothetical protein